MNVALDESVVILGAEYLPQRRKATKETDYFGSFTVCDCVMLNESEASAFCFDQERKISRFFAGGSE